MAKSVYEMVTERIISQLENGVIPWEKPWAELDRVHTIGLAKSRIPY